jgi:hypothetical protein
MNREWLWWVTGYSQMFAVVEGSAVVRPVVRRRMMSNIHSDFGAARHVAVALYAVVMAAATVAVL